ncbi:hypothetical protein BGW42_000820 [Actinomortierella wolfii]|nr:hypothetical protein BGW42_000820 [Actinomortierella wolfii]
MDTFWNKLRKRIISPPKAHPSSAIQLSRFSKNWNAILNCLKSPEKCSLDVSQTEIPKRLKWMVDLLVDEESSLEEASGTTGVCMEFLLKNGVLAILVNISEGDRPRGIKGETIRTVAAMINLLDDRFLVHNAVHKPTVKLLRTTCVPTEDDPQGDSYHEDLVDLMYILCSKIHGFPDLLNIFFHDKQWLTEPQRHARRLERKQNTMELLRTLSQGVADSAAAASTEAGDQETTPQTATDPLTSTEPAETTTHDEAADNTEQRAGDSVESPEMARSASETPKKREYEFFLFTYLLQFIHREGKVGDFARTGLLFIMELATDSLGEYIVDSGYPEFFVSGVGALYSQLPRKLIVRGGPTNINGMVGTLSNKAPPSEGGAQVHSRRAGIEVSTSVEFQSRLDAFLKLLEFCQDVLMRCPSSEISSKLLAAIKTVFLENILYPSVLECSDTDGSSVAVISYIDLILQVLEHEALVDLVVGFLMGSDDDDAPAATAAASTNDGDEQGQNKGSSNDAFAHVQNPQKTSPYFMASGRFTLKDLILSRLKSRSQPTVIATLKLLNTVITRHCKYSLKLLSIQPDDKATSFTREDLANELKAEDIPMISHHIQELDLFFALISTINPRNTTDIFCNGYEAYLRDAEGNVETHQCFIRGKEQQALRNKQGSGSALSALERKKLRRRSMKYGHRMDLPEDQSGEAFIEEQLQLQLAQQQAGHGCCGGAQGKHPHDPIPMHRLIPSDPLLQILLGTLSHFFANSVELNLALTGVITSLATCPYRSLEGWLLFRGTDVRTPDEDKLSVEGSDGVLTPLPGPKTSLTAGADQTSQGKDGAVEDSDDEETLPFYLQRGYNKGSAFERSTSVSGHVAFKSFPPFFTMLKTLTQQVDYYRSEIDNFDEFLADRRRTLLVATELNSVIHTPQQQQQHVHSNYHVYQSQLPPPPPQAATEHHVPMLGGGALSGFESLASGWGASAADSLAAAYPTHQVLQQEQQQLLQQRASSATLAVGASSPSSGRAVSPAPQRIQTSFTPASSAAAAAAAAAAAVNSGGLSPAVAAMRIESPRARKSSSPSSLMATPSNMPFLLPPGVGKRPFRSNSTTTGSMTSLGSGSYEASATTPPMGTSVRGMRSYSGSAASAGGVAVGGMAGVIPTSPAGSYASSTTTLVASQSYGHHHHHQQGQYQYQYQYQYQQSYQPQQDVSAMAKMMESMMIKPLFPDGFVDDSDSEADKGIDLDAELRDVEDEDENKDEEEGRQQEAEEATGAAEEDENNAGEASSSSASTKRTRDASTGGGVPASSNNNSKAKTVTLGQLLTNVVILEEVVKEVVAVTQVRRGLGVDKVRFL